MCLFEGSVIFCVVLCVGWEIWFFVVESVGGSICVLGIWFLVSCNDDGSV